MHVDITDDVVADFRRMLPAFRDETTFPDEVVEQQMIEADAWTGGRFWGEFDIDEDRNLKKRGMYYLTAHFISTYWGTDASDPSSIRPDARLNVTSKSVGDESVSYRMTALENTIDDFLSTTIYGTNFMKLRRQATCIPMVI